MQPLQTLSKDQDYEKLLQILNGEIALAQKLSPFVFEGAQTFAEAAFRIGRRVKEFREKRGWPLEILIELGKDLGAIHAYDLMRYYNFFIAVEAQAKNLPFLRPKKERGAL